MTQTGNPDQALLGDLADSMDTLLSCVTGLDEFLRKQVVYYTLATHALESLATFPILVPKGPTGTGKSSCLEVIARFAYRPLTFSLKSMTSAAIRDRLTECRGGTAIIEEADQAWKTDGFESLLSDRYKKATAKAARKVPDGEGGWLTQNSAFFGATVLHRRIPFADAAVSGRSVPIRFRAVNNRTFAPLDDIVGKELVLHESVPAGSLTGLMLPDVPSIRGIAGRVLDTYRPILAIAQILGDEKFANQMAEHLGLENTQLKESQSFEPDGVVLRALILRVTEKNDALDFGRNVRVSNIAQTVWDSERVTMTPRQVAALLRDLGFETKNSHGLTVVVPKPATLVRACKECGYEDDSIAALRTELLSGREGREGGSSYACGERDEGGPVQVPAIHSTPPHAGKSLPGLPSLPEPLTRTTEQQELADMKEEELAKLRATRPFINEDGSVNLGDPRFYGLKSWDDIPSPIQAAKRRRPK